MADLVFKTGIDTTYNGVALNKTSEGVLQEATPSGNYTTRDVVHITFTDTYLRGVFAICTNGATGTFAYDTNIYNVGPSSISAKIDVYNQAEAHAVDNYRIGVDVENSLYSKSYKKYASNTTYTLTAPLKREQYFGSIDNILHSEDTVFADYCDNKAYGIGFSEGTFDLLNNKFKSSLEFSVATR